MLILSLFFSILILLLYFVFLFISHVSPPPTHRRQPPTSSTTDPARCALVDVLQRSVNLEREYIYTTTMIQSTHACFVSPSTTPHHTTTRSETTNEILDTRHRETSSMKNWDNYFPSVSFPLHQLNHAFFGGQKKSSYAKTFFLFPLTPPLRFLRFYLKAPSSPPQPASSPRAPPPSYPIDLP